MRGEVDKFTRRMILLRFVRENLFWCKGSEERIGVLCRRVAHGS
jgi:hypothetical protein